VDSLAVGGDISEEMRKCNSGGEEEGMARQQATRDEFGRVRGPTDEK
jgi:hypothetical protein